MPFSPDEYVQLLIISHFRDPADEDYYFARLAWHERLPRQFFWSANQAIEKYLKCIFIRTGRDPKFGHDWFEAYQKARQENFSPLLILPDFLISPERNGHQEKVTMNNFLKRFHESGVTNVRYNEIIFNNVEFYDLAFLDIVCVWLRCICIPGIVLKPGQITDPERFAVDGLSKKIAASFKKDNVAFFPKEAVASDPFSDYRSSTLANWVIHAKHTLSDWEFDYVIQTYAEKRAGGQQDKESKKVYKEILAYLKSLGSPPQL